MLGSVGHPHCWPFFSGSLAEAGVFSLLQSKDYQREEPGAASE